MKSTLKQPIQAFAYIAIVTAFIITLSACGQKGSLYLGQAKPAPTPKQSFKCLLFKRLFFYT